MSDITNLFQVVIKNVKSRNKHLPIAHKNDKTRILASSRPKTEFSINAKKVVTSVSRLKEFLLEHRRLYLDVENHLKSENTSMTDAERDQIDLEAQKLMQACSEAIKLLRTEVSKENLTPHVREHRVAVVAMMQAYLKGVCKIYSEQRAVRVKRVVDKKRIGRLEPERRHRPAQNGFQRSSSQDSASSHHSANSEEPLDKSTPESHWGERSTASIHGSLGHSSSSRLTLMSPVTRHESYNSAPSDDVDQLSPEEAQMFEEENQHLFEEMNSMVDEVRQIEGKVVEISKLQEIFADKVLEQEVDIDRIGHLVVGTTENVKEGNEQIREAMKNNAGFRVWILFFLVVCSFSLLFLDWYND